MWVKSSSREADAIGYELLHHITIVSVRKPILQRRDLVGFIMVAGNND